MTDRSHETPDPLIDEVRQRRRELLERFNNDLNAFAKFLQERQNEHPHLIVSRLKTLGSKADTKR